MTRYRTSTAVHSFNLAYCFSAMLTLLCTFLLSDVVAQKNSETYRAQLLNDETLSIPDVKNEFIKYDIAPLLTQTSNSIVLGFIGENYQRINVKLVSVIKNKAKPSEYFVYGKSMVKGNICEFQGTITVTNVFNLKGDAAGEKRGKVIGEYLFYENPMQKHVGLFQGVFSTNWYLDKAGILKYDDLEGEGDGFSNNEFVGTWSSYSGKLVQACNWGDSRIPMSGDLDVGAGEFSPDAKYQANGWTTYVQAYSGNSAEESEKARKAENAEWWK